MNTKLYILFFVLLLLMSILSNIYQKYNSACVEYFSTDKEYNISEALKQITAWKKETSKKLCEIQAFLDSSIGFNQINSVSKDSKDSEYSMTNVNNLNKINGKDDYSVDNKLVFDSFVINDKNELCEIPLWKPDKIEDKDSIVVYITVLVQQYNENVLALEQDKINISSYIQNFNRFFLQYLDNKLLPNCDRLTGEERKTLCTAETKVNENNIAEISKKSQTLIDDKKKELDKKMCNFIKKYKKTEYIRDAIINYINKLNDIWSLNDINKTKVRLNYATTLSSTKTTGSQ